MLEFLQTTPAQLVMGLAVLAILSVGGYYVVARFRGDSSGGGPTASDLLSNFREIHHQGDIDEAEYRKIKTALSAKLQQDTQPKESPE